MSSTHVPTQGVEPMEEAGNGSESEAPVSAKIREKTMVELSKIARTEYPDISSVKKVPMMQKIPEVVC